MSRLPPRDQVFVNEQLVPALVQTANAFRSLLHPADVLEALAHALAQQVAHTFPLSDQDVAMTSACGRAMEINRTYVTKMQEMADARARAGYGDDGDSGSEFAG